MSSIRRVLWGICALVGIVIIGIIGYMVIEGWSLLDALYMTIITITTVGFNEVHSLDSNGRIFSIFLILGGVGGALYALTGIVQYVIEGNIGTTWERRRMKNKIAMLKGHFILCGFGRVGEEIASTFNEEGVPFVVIENRSECINRLEKTGYLYLHGNATSDDILEEAGIKHARGLVAAVGADVDNTYITLSARGMRPDLFIEARASSEEAITKLEKAGANRIISPEVIGGRRMAMLALRPAVVDFLDTIIHSRGREMQMENVDIGENSQLVGLTVKATRKETGVTILAIRKKGGTLISNPDDEEIIKEGDQIIVMGTRNHLATLEKALQ